MPRKTMSVRLSDELREQLDAAADVEDTTVTALVERFVREGLATADHPGIVFALRHSRGSESKRVAALASEFGIHARQVSIALGYIVAHRDEIDAQVRTNDRALRQAERHAAERERLLA